MNATFQTFMRALALAGVLTVTGYDSRARADSSSRSLPSFRNMERITKKVQRPLVDAVVEVHQSLAKKIADTSKEITQVKQQKEGQVVLQYLPAVQPLVQNLTTSSFGQQFFDAVRAEAAGSKTAAPATARVESAPVQDASDDINDDYDPVDPVVDDQDSSFILPGFQNKDSLSEGEMNRLGTLTGELKEHFRLAYGLPEAPADTADAAGYPPAVNVTADMVERLREKRVLYGEKLSTARADLAILTTLAESTRLDLRRASRSLSDAQEKLSLNSVAQASLKGGAATIEKALAGAALGRDARKGLVSPLTSDATTLSNTVNSLKAEITSLTSTVSRLRNTLSSLQGQINLLKMVDIPFFEVANNFISSAVSAGSLGTIAGAGLSILSPFGFVADIVGLIRQFTSIETALSFIGGSFMSVTATVNRMANLVTELFSGGLLVSIFDRFIDTPLDLARTLISRTSAPSQNLVNLLGGSAAVFGSSVHAAISGLPQGLQLPMTVGAGPMASGKDAGDAVMEPGATLLARATAAQSSTSAAPRIPFGGVLKKATSKNFCSTVSKAQRSGCISREAKNWIRATASMRTVVRQGASQLKSPTVVKQLEKEVFGKELSVLLGGLTNKARAIPVPQ